MDDGAVRLQNDVLSLLQDELFPVHDEDRYFWDCQMRPRYGADGLLALEDVSFVWRSTGVGEVRTNDVLSDSRLSFIFHRDRLDAPDGTLTSRLSSFSIRLDLSDLPERDVVLWERYRRDGRYTGRLKFDDTTELNSAVRAADAVVCGVEFLLFERVPDHDTRSATTELDSRLVELWNDDYEILDALRRR